MNAELLCCGGCNSFVIHMPDTEIYCSVCGRKLKLSKATGSSKFVAGKAYPLSVYWDEAADKETMEKLRTALAGRDYAEAAGLIRLYESEYCPDLPDPDSASALAEHMAYLLLDGGIEEGSMEQLFAAVDYPFIIMATYTSMLSASRESVPDGFRRAAVASARDIFFTYARHESNFLMLMGTVGILVETMDGMQDEPAPDMESLAAFSDLLRVQVVAALASADGDPQEVLEFWKGKSESLYHLLEQAWGAVVDGDTVGADRLLKEYALRYISMNGDWENYDIFDLTDFVFDKCRGVPEASAEQIAENYGDRPWWPELDSAFAHGSDSADMAKTAESLLDSHPDDEDDLRICICSRTIDWIYGNVLEGRECGPIDGLVALFPETTGLDSTDHFTNYTAIMGGLAAPIKFIDDPNVLKTALKSIMNISEESVRGSFYLFEMSQLLGATSIILDLLQRAADSPEFDRRRTKGVSKTSAVISQELRGTCQAMSEAIAGYDHGTLVAWGDWAYDNEDPMPDQMADALKSFAALATGSSKPFFSGLAGKIVGEHIDRCLEAVGGEWKEPEDDRDDGSSVRVGVDWIERIGRGEPVEGRFGLFETPCPHCGKDSAVNAGMTVTACRICGETFSMDDAELDRFRDLRDGTLKGVESARKLLSRNRLDDAQDALAEAMKSDPYCWQGWLLQGRIEAARINLFESVRSWTEALEELVWADREDFETFYNTVLETVHDTIFSNCIAKGGDASRVNLTDLALLLDVEFGDWLDGRHLMTDLLDMIGADVRRCTSPQALFYLAAEYSLTAINCHYEFNDIRKHIEICDKVIDLEPAIIQRMGKLRGSQAAKAPVLERLANLFSMYSSMRTVMAEGISGLDAKELDRLAAEWTPDRYYRLAEDVMDLVPEYMSEIHTTRPDFSMAEESMREYVRTYVRGPSPTS